MFLFLEGKSRTSQRKVTKRKEKHRKLGLNVREDAAPAATSTTDGGKGKAQSCVAPRGGVRKARQQADLGLGGAMPRCLRYPAYKTHDCAPP